MNRHLFSASSRLIYYPLSLPCPFSSSLSSPSSPSSFPSSLSSPSWPQRQSCRPQPSPRPFLKRLNPLSRSRCPSFVYGLMGHLLTSSSSTSCPSFPLHSRYQLRSRTLLSSSWTSSPSWVPSHLPRQIGRPFAS